jgi:beta-glucosidase/6-phospho-beta-glucosidase/beta-galactosidase
MVSAIPKFRSFMWAGFECTYARVANGKRLDILHETRHDEYCRIDYNLIKDLGIYTAREGLSWSEIDKGSHYDFSRFEKMMEIGNEEGIEQIWDLNHFDYPEDLDPFSLEFIERFARYAAEAIQVIRKYIAGTIYIAPINEISFFSLIGGDNGNWAPYATGRGFELKKQLVKASIKAMDAIWAVEPNVRFIQVDPIFYRTAKRPFTDTTLKIAREFKEIKFQAWDMLCGKLCPELGGHPKYLDILGANYYYYNQEWVIPDLENGFTYKTIPWFSKHRISVAKMLNEVYTRYRRPIVTTETGGWGDLRKIWWKRTFKQIDEALDSGLPVYGICSYPIVDRRDWDHGHLTNSGFWDFADDDPTCIRIPHPNTIEIVKNYLSRKSQKNLTAGMPDTKLLAI